MRIPVKQKFKKQQKGKAFNKVTAVRGLNQLKFGSFGLRVLESGRITFKQLESIYLCINKHLKKNGRVVLKVSPQTPITSKPIEVRMGKGKGNVDYWVVKVKAGSILCEVTALVPAIGLKALIQAQYKIPLKTKIF